jgi:hypothetical protein
MTPQPTASNLAAWAGRAEQGGNRLHGRWLVAARAAWLSLAGLTLLTLLVALPVFHRAMYSVRTPESALPGQLTGSDLLLLQDWGVPLDVYAAYQTGLIAVFALVFMLAGALLFRRRAGTASHCLFRSGWC